MWAATARQASGEGARREQMTAGAGRAQRDDGRLTTCVREARQATEAVQKLMNAKSLAAHLSVFGAKPRRFLTDAPSGGAHRSGSCASVAQGGPSWAHRPQHYFAPRARRYLVCHSGKRGRRRPPRAPASPGRHPSWRRTVPRAPRATNACLFPQAHGRSSPRKAARRGRGRAMPASCGALQRGRSRGP